MSREVKHDDAVTYQGLPLLNVFGGDEGGLRALDRAIDEYRPVQVYALFSGGHDSLVSTHLTAQHPNFSGVVHCNTGIGIEQTREFVRETCRKYGWPLIEKWPQRMTYEQIVDRWGLPGGPMGHRVCYNRLKKESLEVVVQEAKRDRRDRVLLSTGIRRQESIRRMLNSPNETMREGARVWTAPIIDFSKQDINRYIESNHLERNPVVDKLHRSGECLCGALAQPEELDEIAFWFPDVARYIRGLEKQSFERGLRHNWGSRKQARVPAEQMALPMCSSCETRWDVLL